MRYSLDYVYESSFMREWANDLTIKTQDENAKVVSTQMQYRKANVPGTVVTFTPKYEEGKGMQLGKITQNELNALVNKLQIYTKDGKQITEAPLGTQNHDFWKSEHAYLIINGGHADLDDSQPKDAIMIAAMKGDRHFYVKGETAGPPVKSMVRWMLTPIDGKQSAVVDSESMSIDAVKRLYTMDHETSLHIAKIMGREMSEKTDPSIVQATLFRMITSDRDQMCVDGMSNLEKFTQLASSDNAELNLEALANDAKRLFVKRNGIYYYGEIKMGKNVREVITKFKEDSDILFEINRIINEKK